MTAGVVEVQKGCRSSALSSPIRRVLGGLLRLVDTPAVRDILLVPRQAGTVGLWVDMGSGCAEVPGWELSAAAARELARTLIAAGGSHLDEAQPLAETQLGDGIRVHAVLPPLARAPTLAIRLPAPAVFSFAELVAGGLCGAGTANWLREQVLARKNLLICGGTGSGKTTLLNALLGLVPHGERIVLIEDVAELRPAHPHTVALLSRGRSSEGVGEVSLDELLRAALRMRPDRIVLGECRGAEVATLLAALNTGHAGSCGTLHANTLSGVPARLLALGLLAGVPDAALTRLAAAAFDVVVQVARVRVADPATAAEYGRAAENGRGAEHGSVASCTGEGRMPVRAVFKNRITGVGRLVESGGELRIEPVRLGAGSCGD